MGRLSTRLSTAISGCWHKDKNPFPRGWKFREIIRERFLCGEKLAGFCKALELTEISSFSDSWRGQAASGGFPFRLDQLCAIFLSGVFLTPRPDPTAYPLPKKLSSGRKRSGSFRTSPISGSADS